MSDSPENRPKRQKRGSSYKAKAFEKFKQLKSGNRNKYEVEEIENVYETVEEKEYVKQVLKRHDDNWIVDDDGSGYVEDGRDIFDDDLDAESIAQASSSRGKGVKRKKKGVSENAGKGKLQYMISNMPSKKTEEKKIEGDDVLSELLEEIDAVPSTSKIKPKELRLGKEVVNDYIKTFKSSVKKSTIKPKVSTTNGNKLSTEEIKKKYQNKCLWTLEPHEMEELQSSGWESKPEDKSQSQINDVTSSEKTLNETEDIQECFDDDIDLSLCEDADSQSYYQIPEEFLTEWENMGDTSKNEPSVGMDNFEDLPLLDDTDKKIFRFFWWDAYEDPEKQKGTVFLFGKTFCNKSKSYVSCCVAVREIPRRIFVLPRTFENDRDGKPTDKAVTDKSLYSEFNDEVMRKMYVSSFKTRCISKKYAFNPEIPSVSDYMEVQYSANFPPIPEDVCNSARTFSKIFGINTSFLEFLLLERKIKGPCWLDVTNPEPVSNPFSWCRFEVNCQRLINISVVQAEKIIPPPPLTVAAIHLRCVVNPKTMANEVVMISCLSHTKYCVDKPPPAPPFEQHFCVLTAPNNQILPLDIHNALTKYKLTQVQKINSERALINYFLNQFTKIDPDLIVGHDMQGYELNVLSDCLIRHRIKDFSKFGRLKRSSTFKLDRTLFLGRLVCDIKISAKELIKSRSYDLEALCQSILKLKENERIDLEPEEVGKMFQTSESIVNLVTFTMKDASYILQIMYNLNVLPLALQITNIAGNVMSKTLMGGRSERNEFLLLHAFSEKDYIVPDKEFKKNVTTEKRSTSSRKKPTYSGGLVLEPKVGFYDKFILLMDFNSLYPSIIQEYNICFTTMPSGMTEDNIVLPDRNLPPGILPTEIRKLVESRRQVKKLMANPDLSNEMRMQYHIRQMALKLTANSMYGCLGFSNSRFYARNLAALVTHKGREILTNTKDLVEKMSFEVVYGDTDSIMINTNCLDYDQVFKMGHKIKQEVNKLYKQVELDIDGVFKYLLLLKKKKYAAVTLSKTKNGEIKAEKEYKGLDIVRRDWSRLASEAGKFILEHILSDQTPDDRIDNIHAHLDKIKKDLKSLSIPLPLLVITKQLTKDPKMYTDASSLPHVQVALRYNKTSGGHFRAGDTIPYVICDDGSNKPATQRAYHVDEFKNSSTLKIDVNYYLSQQIYPVVSRICEPIEGIDAYQIASRLGMDMSTFRAPKDLANTIVEDFVRLEVRFRNVDEFRFTCVACKTENLVNSALVGNEPFLNKCNNLDCTVRPVDYLPNICNELVLQIRSYIKKYYNNELICEDPACINDTRRMPLRFAGKFPVCTLCNKGVMYRKYTEYELYSQLTYFLYMFDLSKVSKKPLMEYDVEEGYHKLRVTVERYLNRSGYSIVNLTELFSGFTDKGKTSEELTSVEPDIDFITEDQDEGL